MEGPGLAPSPFARMLLDAAEREAEGSITVGGRKVVVRGDRIVSVEPTEDDEDLGAFAVRARRIDAAMLATARADAKASGASIDEALLRLGVLTKTALGECRRAVWLDRVVRGLSDDEAHTRTPRHFVPDPPSRRGADRPGVDLVRFVLDVLSRRAADRDAEEVGKRAGYRLVIVDGPHREKAAMWAELDGDRELPTLASLLSRAPAGAPRLAALIRAGLAHLVPPRESAPPPPRRPPSIAPPGHADHEASLASQATLRPAAPTKLEPGSAPRPIAQALALQSRFPAFAEPLDDPLDPVERRINALEQAGAPSEERAAAWKELARLWQSRYRSVAEAARSYREAAAADPRDLEALTQSSALCAAAGRLDLGAAYARAAVRAAEGERRVRALLRLARLSLRAGDAASCVEALSQATAPEHGSDAARELLFEVLRLGGEAAPAVAQARRAAAALAESRRDRARSILAWAHSAAPTDTEVSLSYAEALRSDGFEDGAVFVLSDAAHRAHDPDTRRTLRLAAAERAELAGRQDLAAQLLTEAFDAEPHFDILYEPLSADLEGSGATFERAVLLEAVANACQPEEQVLWLTRAADAHHGAGSSIEHVLELLARALIVDPAALEPLEAVRRHARDQGDLNLLVDTLERVARAAAGSHAASVKDLLLELAEAAEHGIDSPRRALWAYRRYCDLVPGDPHARSEVERLATKVRVKNEVVALANRDFEEASGVARPAAARRLATILRDHPDERQRAKELYRDVLRDTPDDPSAGGALERLLWILGDIPALIEQLTARAGRTSEQGRGLSLLLRVSGLCALEGDYRKSAEAARAVLAIDDVQREAVARLLRAAQVLCDTRAMVEALQADARSAVSAANKSRALAALGARQELTGDVERALSNAARAVALDPRAGDAAMLRARHLNLMPESEAVEVLLALRNCFGDSPPLLARLADVAEKALDPKQRDEALIRWCGLSPLDPEPAARRLVYGSMSRDAGALRHAIEHAIDTYAIDATLVIQALERLSEIADPQEAAPVALRAVDRLGNRSPELVALATRLAERSGRLDRRIAALERDVVFRDKPGRAAPLLALSALHREAGDRAAEARTLLRVLAVEKEHPGALARLTQLYAETGESERLVAVLALRLSTATDAAERRERLMDLAVASLEHEGDAGRAAGFVRSLVDEAEGDPEAVEFASTALVSLAKTTEAVELLSTAAERFEARDAGRLFARAMAIAEVDAEDAELALSTAVRGLSHAPSEPALLLSFERLALDLGDVATARRTYQQLVDSAMGPHGRRALLYRMARWLERAGDRVGALDAYYGAFEHAPSAGVTFRSIERLSTELSIWAPLASAYLQLAVRLPYPDARLGLLSRAASVAEREMDDPSGAFDLLAEAFRQTGKTSLLDELRRLARVLVGREPKLGNRASRRIESDLRTRAEKAWDDEDRFETLLMIAELIAVDRGNVEAGAAEVDQAIEATRDELPTKTVADALCLVAGWYETLPHGRTEASSRVTRALWVDRENERARELAPRLGVEIPDAGADADAVADTDEPEAARPTDPDLVPANRRAPTRRLRPVLRDESDEPDGEDEGASKFPRRDTQPIPGVAPSVGARTASPTETSDNPPADDLDTDDLDTDAEDPGRQTRPGPGPGTSTASNKTSVSEDTHSAISVASGPVESERPRRPTLELVPEFDDADEPFEAAPGGSSKPPSVTPGPSESPSRTASSVPTSSIAELDDPAPSSSPPPSASSPPAPRHAETRPYDLSKLPSDQEPRSDADDLGPASDNPAPSAQTPQQQKKRVTRSFRPRKTSDPMVVPGHAVVAASSDATARRSERPPALEQLSPASGADVEEQQLRSAMGRGDVDAGLRLAERLTADPRRAHEGVDLLRWVVRRDPSRTSALRALRDASARIGAEALREVTEEILSLFDQRVDPPTTDQRRYTASFFDVSSTPLVDESLHGMTGVLGRVWDGARPLFRRSITDFGVSGTHRLQPFAPRPVARAFDEALRTLSPGEVQLYVRRDGALRIEVARTSPASVVSSDWDSDSLALRFRMGRAVDLARRESVLLSTLDEEDGRILLSAILAAFGPAELAKSAPKKAVALAAGLWTMSARDQAAVRAFLETEGHIPEYQTLRDAVFGSAARAGLLLSGCVHTSVQTIVNDDPSLGVTDLSTEAAYVAGCQQSQSLRDLLSFAYSDAYVAARSRATSAR